MEESPLVAIEVFEQFGNDPTVHPVNPLCRYAPPCERGNNRLDSFVLRRRKASLADDDTIPVRLKLHNNRESWPNSTKPSFCCLSTTKSLS